MPIHIPGLQVLVRDVLIKGHESWRDVAFVLLLTVQSPELIAGQGPQMQFQTLPFVFDPEKGGFAVVVGSKLRMKP